MTEYLFLRSQDILDAIEAAYDTLGLDLDDLAAYPDPISNDADALGRAGVAWSDLFLASGGTINWANGGIRILEASDFIAFQLAQGYSFDNDVYPATNGAGQLGFGTNGWDGLYLTSGGDLNWNNGAAILRQSGGVIVATTGLMQLGTSAGTACTQFLNSAAGNERSFVFRSAGVERFALGVDSTAESGSSAGSSFFLNSYSDAGSYLYTPLFVARAGLGTVDIVGARFTAAGTTGSAANAFLDSGDGNRIYRSTSSGIYKKDVEDLDAQWADPIMSLRPVWYRSLAEMDENKSFYGLIAEEVAAIEPRLVNYGYHDDDYEEVELKEVIEQPVTEDVEVTHSRVVVGEDGIAREIVEKTIEARPKMVEKQLFADDGVTPFYELDAFGEPTRPITVQVPVMEKVERIVRRERVLKPGAKLKPDGVAYDRLSVFLLYHMKKQQESIAALISRVEALEQTKAA